MDGGSGSGGLADAVQILKQGIHEVASAAEAREAALRSEGAAAAHRAAAEAERLEAKLSQAEHNRAAAAARAADAERRSDQSVFEMGQRVAAERAASVGRMRVALSVGTITAWVTGIVAFAAGAATGGI